MPKKKSKVVLAAVPAVPLALALVYSALIPGSAKPTGAVTKGPVQCEEPIEDFRACHSEYPSGCSAKGTDYDFYLNLLKNQTKWASSQVVTVRDSLDQYKQLESQVPDQLGKRNHQDFAEPLAKAGEGKLNGVVGYLYGAKAEGKESSNCQLDPGDNNENVDFHIWIGFDEGIAAKLRNKQKLTATEKKSVKQEAVIVEMTPQTREILHADEWTLDALKAALGRQVRVVGQLMVDNEHNVASQNCGRSDATDLCWRASVWELHPVTEFQVCKKGEGCGKSNSADWEDLGGGP